MLNHNFMVWRIIGRVADIDVATIEGERNRYLDLHLDRFTYYPFHERPRYERDYVHRQV